MGPKGTSNEILSKVLNDAGTALKADVGVGAANVAIAQVTAGASSGVLVTARATRRSVLVRNTHATDDCYVGTGTVTSSNGFLLKAGESVPFYNVAALNCIRGGSNNITICYVDEYD